MAFQSAGYRVQLVVLEIGFTLIFNWSVIGHGF